MLPIQFLLFLCSGSSNTILASGQCLNCGLKSFILSGIFLKKKKKKRKSSLKNGK